MTLEKLDNKQNTRRDIHGWGNKVRSHEKIGSWGLGRGGLGEKQRREENMRKCNLYSVDI